MEYDFTLKFALGRHDADPEAFIGPLLEAGCDDALIGIGKLGQVALDFSREATSAEEAVLSALADVRRAIPDATFIEATPDYVGIPDIAEVLGVSRQYIARILHRNVPGLPQPIHAGARTIWHLETILTWLVEQRIRKVDSDLLEVSRVNMKCNFARERRKLAHKVPDTYLQAVG